MPLTIIKNIRYYIGKYKIGTIEKIKNKSYVIFLEFGIIGNKKIGYRGINRGEKIFLYTRSCYKNRKKEN